MVLPRYYLLSPLVPFSCPCLHDPRMRHSSLPPPAHFFPQSVLHGDDGVEGLECGRQEDGYSPMLERAPRERASRVPAAGPVGGKAEAGHVRSCFLCLLPPRWLWIPGKPLSSSPSISVAFTIRHSSSYWNIAVVFLIPYEISWYTTRSGAPGAALRW